MNIRTLLGAAGVGIALVAPVSAATHIYDLVPFALAVSGSNAGDFDGAYDVTGQIETDGMLGVLTPANILSSALTATRQGDGLELAIHVALQSTPADQTSVGSVTLTGGVLAATETSLMLQLDPGGAFVFSDGTNRFGFTDGSVVAFLEIPAQGIFAQATVSTTDNAGIANAPTAPVPLPPSAMLVAGAIGMLRAMARGQGG